MRLHEDKKLFEQAIRFTAQEKGLRAIYVEKDYWVTYALYLIFHADIKDQVVFKGGTSLSKCYPIIERFSEDIDLVVLSEKGDSGNKLKKRLKAISTTVAVQLAEIEISELTNKKGMIRKTAHVYTKQFEGAYGQVRDFIVLESSWLGNYEPYSLKEIHSYVYEMMLKRHQLEMAKEYGLMPFEVNVLDVERTICEKVMSLVRFSYSKNPIEDLQLKIRHTYDLHQLLKLKEVDSFFESSDFDQMINNVGQDDVTSFKTNNGWLEEHPKKALIFQNTEEIWNQIKSNYLNEFEALVYGKLPDEVEVLKTLVRIAERLQSIDWRVKL